MIPAPTRLAGERVATVCTETLGDLAKLPTAELLAREAGLMSWFRDAGSALIGFSGGVDSAYLACVAVDALGADRVLAVIGRSPSYPMEQWERARQIAERFAIPVLEIETHEMADPEYAANPTNRCYFCKNELWSLLVQVASARKLALVCDGTNADDLTDYRPGARAAMERNVRSPLAELRLTKSEIRALSQRRDIPTWSVPSSPCLSSRLPYGTAVTMERLAQVERAERALRNLGIQGDLRVRHHGDLARIELGKDELSHWLLPARAGLLQHAVRSSGYARVAIDLRGFRSGSLNVLEGVRE
jgi:uncharacterized protein